MDAKVRVTFYVDSDRLKRFRIHAINEGVDPSSLFVEMVDRICDRFVVTDTAKPGQPEAS